MATVSVKILQSQGAIFSLDSDEKEMIGMEREQNKDDKTSKLLAKPTVCLLKQ